MTSRALVAVVLVAVLVVGGAVGITYLVTSGGSSRTGIVRRSVEGCQLKADGSGECKNEANSEAKFVCAHTHASVVEVHADGYEVGTGPATDDYRISC